jgi:hypothetical protein
MHIIVYSLALLTPSSISHFHTPIKTKVTHNEMEKMDENITLNTMLIKTDMTEVCAYANYSQYLPVIEFTQRIGEADHKNYTEQHPQTIQRL